MLAVLGVFIFIDTSILAQSTGTAKDEAEISVRRAEHAEQEARIPGNEQGPFIFQGSRGLCICYWLWLW